MIVVKLIGGLGNQMFQYATGKALAQHFGVKLYLDANALKLDSNGKYTQRKFELNTFRINAEIATDEQLQMFNLKASPAIVRFQRLFHSAFNSLIINERGQNYHSGLKKYNKNLYLNGYWQSEKYFLDIRSTLLDEFRLKGEFSSSALKLLEEIEADVSVSIHVRRGDYVNHPVASRFHGALPVEYFLNAVDNIRKEFSDPNYFVFSDDIPWCKDHFNFSEKIKYVEAKEELSPQEEMMLMSKCRHNIIANSSFSWWAAWLNQNPHKQVIAPFNWYKESKMETRDLIPETWKRLQ